LEELEAIVKYMGFGFTNQMRFPDETVINKDTEVSYTQGRRKWLIIEVKWLGILRGEVQRYHG